MDKTEKLIDWEENEKRDKNRDGIDDRIEPGIPDVSVGSQKLADRVRENPGIDPSLSGNDLDAQMGNGGVAGRRSSDREPADPRPERHGRNSGGDGHLVRR